MHYRPIHDAIDIGALDIVQSLVQHGADPTAELGDKTPLYLAKTNKRPEIYDYLLRKPYNPLTVTKHVYQNYTHHFALKILPDALCTDTHHPKFAIPAFPNETHFVFYNTFACIAAIVNDYQARRKAQMASSVAPSTKSTKRVIKHSVEVSQLLYGLHACALHTGPI